MSNFIIHQKARQYEWKGDCFLSVKSFYDGYAKYQVANRQYTINSKRYLVLNECTNYKLQIDTPSETESFCIFFDPYFVSKTYVELTSQHTQLIDSTITEEPGISFFERQYSQTGKIAQLLSYGRNHLINHQNTLATDEFYHSILKALLELNNASQLETTRLSFSKKSTREEIYKRIYYSKDYIDANYQNTITLNEISGIAMLSPNHYLRCFKELIGLTPFQYLNLLRIQKAKELLAEGELLISEIITYLGYSSLNNFSSYFKSIVGCSPKDYRKKVISSK